MNDVIYLDNASTTFPSKECIAEFIECANEYYNPSSTYCKGGINAHNRIEESRKIIADTIHADKDEIYFTSGGSEANSWAIMGMYRANNIHTIITTDIEHSSTYNAVKYLEDRGVLVLYLPIDKYGIVNEEEYITLLENCQRRMRSNTLIAIMHMNNEIGTVNDIGRLASIAKEYDNTWFFTDCVQSFCKYSIDVNGAFKDVDLLSASGHKIGCFSGIGFLYIKEGTNIDPLIFGGKQERGIRGGTENYCYIIPFANQVKRMNQFRLGKGHYLMATIKNVIGDIVFNSKYYSNIQSITINGVDSGQLISMLDMYGYVVSAGSACSSGSSVASRVLTNLGISEEAAKSTIRISVNDDTSYDDIVRFVDALKQCVDTLRTLNNLRGVEADIITSNDEVRQE